MTGSAHQVSSFTVSFRFALAAERTRDNDDDDDDADHDDDDDDDAAGAGWMEEAIEELLLQEAAAGFES